MKSLTRGLSYVFVAIIVLGVVSPWSFHFVFLVSPLVYNASGLYTLSVLIRIVSRMVTLIRNTYFPRVCGICLFGVAAPHTGFAVAAILPGFLRTQRRVLLL